MHFTTFSISRCNKRSNEKMTGMKASDETHARQPSGRIKFDPLQGETQSWRVQRARVALDS